MRDYPRLIISAPLVRSFDDGFTDNSVLPNPTKNNRYGDPLPVVTFEPNPTEAQWVEDAVAHAKQIMVNAGADTSRMWNGGIDVVHKVGTCRMGTDPATSVTDLYGKMWDLDNVWISDGSLFPAPLLANCAFIIYTLAYRIADKLLDRETPTA